MLLAGACRISRAVGVLLSGPAGLCALLDEQLEVAADEAYDELQAALVERGEVMSDESEVPEATSEPEEVD